jgi:hypothetical protein
VVEAAHIQPYLGERSNHVGNGIGLRVDVHRLFSPPRERSRRQRLRAAIASISARSRSRLKAT